MSNQVQYQSQSQSVYLLPNQLNIQNKSSINCALIIALIAFLSDMIIVPLIGFTLRLRSVFVL